MNFIKHFRRRSGAILLFGLTILAHGSVNDAELQKQYQGQVLTLRQFYPGKHLHFDTTGKLVSAVARCMDGGRAGEGTGHFFERWGAAHQGTTVVSLL